MTMMNESLRPAARGQEGFATGGPNAVLSFARAVTDLMVGALSRGHSGPKVRRRVMPDDLGQRMLDDAGLTRSDAAVMRDLRRAALRDPEFRRLRF